MLISIQDLDVFYGPIQALYNVNLEVEQGEIVAIVGNNGAGKSTMLKTISGLVKPNKGQIIFDGKTIN